MNSRTREILNRLTNLRERIDTLKLDIEKLECQQNQEQPYDGDIQQKIWCAKEALVTLETQYLGWQLQWEHDIAMVHYHG